MGMGEEMRHVDVQHRCAGEASIQVKEASSNNGYEAEGKAF